MSGDKRSVSTDALETLGTIINEHAGRDAIHLAVEPVIAAEKLYPGQDVGFVAGGVGKSDQPLGIVDPFLKAPIQPGERFWLVVYPRQITSLRHVWSHPDFADKPESRSRSISAEESETWLREFIAKSDCPGYDMVVALASGQHIPKKEGYSDSYVDDEYMHFSGMDAHGEIPPEFWDHLENITGKKITQRPSFFSCSC